MAHNEQKNFCLRVKEKLPHFFSNKKILDIGSLDINGNNRDLFENCDYLGIDIGEGKNVDLVSVGHLFEGPDNYYDVIISTEVFEHDIYYEKTIKNIIRMLKPGGLFLFTCAAPGRPEHGTKRTEESSAPLLSKISDEWGDYYKNLSEENIRKISNFNESFPDCHFELGNPFQGQLVDLYFYGIKGGEKYLIENISPVLQKNDWVDHIFVIDAWPNDESKENDLINLIKILKSFNIEILLATHYPIKPEIQNMVDYYIYDKKNPILTYEEYDSFNINDERWTRTTEYYVSNIYEFHHDYSIWETMKNSFNFSKFLNKKYIHFFEYDNLPDPYQYRQSFLETIEFYDAIIYEYNEGSILSDYCGTFIFSIKTDIAINLINQITSKFEYFNNRTKGWQLERIFLEYLKKITNNIKITDYLPNNNELNTQTVWLRDDMILNGARFQPSLCVDKDKILYLHLISGNHKKEADKDYLLEIEYDNFKKFITLKKNEFFLESLGEYKKGKRVKIYYQGVLIINEFLKMDYEKFYHLNMVNFHNNVIEMPKEININFIDGPFVEIKDTNNKEYIVEILDKKNNIYHTNIIKSNMWIKGNRKYFEDWKINIYEKNSNQLIFSHKFNAENKRIYIHLDSNSLGDTLAWFPQVEEFRKKHNCKLVCSTFHNYFFEKEYPEIEFVKPGTVVHNIYAMYKIGWFFNEKNEINFDMNPFDFRDQHLQKTCSDILGLDFKEVIPKINFTPSSKPMDKKYFTIGIHSTAQAKYWNNYHGWQELVNYLKEKGYEVISLSKEHDGYMGNFEPKGVIKIRNKSLDEVMNYIHHSEGFIGISSGLSWLSWAINKKSLFIVTGLSNVEMEDCIRISIDNNEDVCTRCTADHRLDPGDWNWCPKYKGTNRQFECTKLVTSEMVINKIKNFID